MIHLFHRMHSYFMTMNFFYMYQANDKTIIRHAKNLNMFKEQLSYLEEAEKKRSEVRIIQPTGR